MWSMYPPEGITRCALCEAFVPYIDVAVVTSYRPEYPDVDYVDDEWHEPGCPEITDPGCVNGPECLCLRCGGGPDFDWG